MNVIAATSGFGTYIAKQSIYNQFERCEFSLYYENAMPSAVNLQLVFANSQINNLVSCSQPFYTLACDNCLLAGGFSFSNGNVQLFNSSVQANCSFSSASPQVLIMQGNRFWDANLNLKTITKTSTGLYCDNNNTYSPSSSFSATQIFAQPVNPNLIADHTLGTNKISALTANRFLTSDASGFVSTKEYITDSDI